MRVTPNTLIQETKLLGIITGRLRQETYAKNKTSRPFQSVEKLTNAYNKQNIGCFMLNQSATLHLIEQDVFPTFPIPIKLLEHQPL